MRLSEILLVASDSGWFHARFSTHPFFIPLDHKKSVILNRIHNKFKLKALKNTTIRLIRIGSVEVGQFRKLLVRRRKLSAVKKWISRRAYLCIHY